MSESKAREFWIDSAPLFNGLDMYPYKKAFDNIQDAEEMIVGNTYHVIEHSAFVRLQDELEYTKRLLADERSGDCDKDKTIRRLERNLNNSLSENAILREALEFYASGDYWGYEHPSSDIFNSIDSRDLGIGDFQLSEDDDDDGVGGRTAREALEKVSDE